MEDITIRACIEILPNSLCNLKKLLLLDLSGCYNILSIPAEVLAMPHLKIKIGNVITSASEVVVIKVPSRGISPAIFYGNKRNISQLIIHQAPQELSFFRVQELYQKNCVVWKELEVSA